VLNVTLSEFLACHYLRKWKCLREAKVVVTYTSVLSAVCWIVVIVTYLGGISCGLSGPYVAVSKGWLFELIVLVEVRCGVSGRSILDADEWIHSSTDHTSK